MQDRTASADNLTAGCQTRQYKFDDNGNREKLTRYAPGTGGSCAKETEQLQKTWTFDGPTGSPPEPKASGHRSEILAVAAVVTAPIPVVGTTFAVAIVSNSYDAVQAGRRGEWWEVGAHTVGAGAGAGALGFKLFGKSAAKKATKLKPGPRQDRRLSQSHKRKSWEKTLSPAPLAGNQEFSPNMPTGQGRSLRGGGTI